MFTGLVEEIGKIVSKYIDNTTGQTILVINCKLILDSIELGASIAVNGCCLTVTAADNNSITVGLSPETIKLTNLGLLLINDLVNLERSITINTRLGGHLVQGHIDNIGTINNRIIDKDSIRISITTNTDIIGKYIVKKGYITIDGISLTVVNTNNDSNTGFTVIEIMLVQYTQSKVTLTNKSIGSIVNLEADILSKQIYSYLENYLPSIKSRL